MAGNGANGSVIITLVFLQIIMVIAAQAVIIIFLVFFPDLFVVVIKFGPRNIEVDVFIALGRIIAEGLFFSPVKYVFFRSEFRISVYFFRC